MSTIPPLRTRLIQGGPTSAWAEVEVRMFHASGAFVSACQEATVAMHALTAKIREMEKNAEPPRRVANKVKPKEKTKASS